MSDDIDNKVVNMKFDNSQFNSGISTSMSALDRLKEKLNLPGGTAGLDNVQKAANNFNTSKMQDEVQKVQSRFSAMSIVAYTVISDITTRILNAGLQTAKALTIQPLLDGMSIYEQKLKAIQTILANTSMNGETMSTVTKALDNLNQYANLTVYDFGQMASSLGTFTAAGVGLNASVEAIKGIGNLAALSGSSADQTSTAMYQLSQALSTGVVRLQDWNSVVNAGIGGKVFQTALEETARVHGVAVDKMIAKDGSFRNSLQENWLTSDILAETLGKLTGDYTDAQLKSLGYSDAQIKGIDKLAKSALAAATQVKSLPQLLDVISTTDAAQWANIIEVIIGDLPTATKLFTGINNVIGGFITNTNLALLATTKAWAKDGGRTAAIDAIKAAFQDLLAVLKPIHDAFVEVFPPATGAQLAQGTKTIAAFFEKIKLGKADADNLKRTFAGLFAILDILWQVVKGVFKVLGDMFGGIASGSLGILGFTGNIGDLLVKFDDMIKKGDGINAFFSGLGAILAVPFELIGALFRLLASATKGINNLDLSGFTNMWGRLEDRFTSVKTATDAISGAFENLWNWIMKLIKPGVADGVGAKMSPQVNQVLKALNGIKKGINDFFKDGDFNHVLDVINTGLLGAIVIMIKKFFTNGLNVNFNVRGGFLDQIKSALSQTTSLLKSMQTQVKAKTIETIAIALALLTASVIALSLIDSKRLTFAIGALTAMFGDLLGSMAIFDKIVASKGFAKMPLVALDIVLISIAIDVLASAVKKLGKNNWGELTRGLTGITVLLGEILGFSKLFGATDPKKFLITVLGIIGLAGAIEQLAKAVVEIGALDWAHLATGLAGIAGLLTELTLFTKINDLAKDAPVATLGFLILAFALQELAKVVAVLGGMSVAELVKGEGAIAGILAGLVVFSKTLGQQKMFIVTAAGMVILAGALLVMQKAVAKFGDMKWDEIGRGLVGMGGALALVVLAMNFLPGPSSLIGAAALVVVSAALLIMAAAFKKMGTLSWDEIGRGFTVMAGGLILLVAALILLGDPLVLLGAASLIIGAQALAIMAVAFKLMGTQTWDQIGRIFTLMGAGLLILAVGGAALIVAIPGFLGLGIALLLIGTGLKGVGSGILAFAKGIAILVAAGAAGGAAVGLLMVAIEKALPKLGSAMGDALVNMAVSIGDNVPKLVTAFNNVLGAMLDSVVLLAPKIVNTAVVIINLLITAMDALLPNMVTTGIDIFTKILEGIDANIGTIATTGVDIVANFINGVAAGLPGLAQSGVNLVISFVNSVGNAIGSPANQAAMQAAGINLSSAIISGMSGGLISQSSISKVESAALRIAKSIPAAIKLLLGIKSPSKVTHELGEFTAQGLANGLLATSGAVSSAATIVGNSAVTSLKKTLSSIAIDPNMMNLQPTIKPVLDLTQLQKDASLIPGMLAPSNGLTLDKTYVTASKATTDAQANADTSSSDNSGSTTNIDVTLNQTNTSPKALSETEVYRQTNNQISQAKGALEDAVK